MAYDQTLADAEAEIATLRQELAEAVSSLKVAYDRLIEANERAEHWRAKYTKLCVHVVGMQSAHARALAETLALASTTNVAAEGPTYNETAPTVAGCGHAYISTACWHAKTDLGSPEDAARLHGYCAAYTGHAGGKQPAKCKWCPARCSCECHTAATP